jgi:PAS domain S-box-containing protein
MNTETENANDAPRPAANPDRPRREFDEDGSRRELLELLFTHVANAIFLTESDGRIIDVNPAACAMLGFAREELLGMWPWDFVTSASRDEILALIGSTKPGVPVSVQRLYRRKSGESRTMDLRLTRFGCADRELIAASCRDLTEQVDLELRLRDLDERRRIEEELRRLNAELSQQAAHLREVNQTLLDSEQRLRLAIETGRIGLWVWNSTDVTNSGDWSERLKEIFGLPLDAEVTHEMFLKCVHPEDRERVDHAVMQALAGTPGGEYRAEYRTIHPRDGTEHWVTARGQAFSNSDGQAIRFIGTVMDITERKLAEEASVRLTQKLEERVRERTASLLRIQRLSQTGSSSWNVSTGEIVWSEETYRIFGFDPGVKITPEMVASRIHPDDLPKFRQMLASEGEDFQFDHRILMLTGSPNIFKSRLPPCGTTQGSFRNGLAPSGMLPKFGEVRIICGWRSIPSPAWYGAPYRTAISSISTNAGSTTRASRLSRPAVGAGRWPFILRTFPVCWITGNRFWLPESEVNMKRACDGSTASIAGSCFVECLCMTSTEAW